MIDGENIRTHNHGEITAWREVRTPVCVWAAEGRGHDGELHRGYGEDRTKAIVSLLEEFEVARVTGEPEAAPQMWFDEQIRALPPAAPVMPDYPMGSDIAAALDYIRSRCTEQPRHPEYIDLPEQFWAEVQAQQKIKAIRTLRQATRLSLRSAKQIVDAILSEGERVHA